MTLLTPIALTLMASVGLPARGRDCHGAQTKEGCVGIANAGSNDFLDVALAEAYSVAAMFDGHVDSVNSGCRMQEPQLAHPGENGTVNKWSQLGITPSLGRTEDIIRVSRLGNAGALADFLAAVLGKGSSYELGSINMNDSKAVVETTVDTPTAIGYSDLPSGTCRVKMGAVSGTDSGPVIPSVSTTTDRTYPIIRPLFMYTPGEPTGAIEESLDWTLSPAGEKIIEEKGYAPVSE